MYYFEIYIQLKNLAVGMHVFLKIACTHPISLRYVIIHAGVALKSAKFISNFNYNRNSQFASSNRATVCSLEDFEQRLNQVRLLNTDLAPMKIIMT